MTKASQQIYAQIPEFYRIRDVEEGSPLAELIAVIGEQAAILEENVHQLYDDQFVETCADWVVPYIGDLIAYDSLHGDVPNVLSPRAEVANTIAYRRRKGTATVLEQLARDVTGWDARVVEFFQLLATSQHMNHVRLANHYSPHLGSWEPLERIDTAFNSITHTVDVRDPETQSGRFNIPNIGLYLWRLGAYLLHRSPAVAIDGRRLFFSPLGNNTQLLTRPEPEADISHLAEPINVPEPISRNVLNSSTMFDQLYGRGKSINLWVNGSEVDGGDITVCNLEDYIGDWAYPPQSKIAIDPKLGRIYLPAALSGAEVDVRYHHGFSANVGGGGYERKYSFGDSLSVDQSVTSGADLQSAVNLVQGGGVVEIDDFGRYTGLSNINVDANNELQIRSRNDQRATIVTAGDVEIVGGHGATVILNGLLITAGSLLVPAGNNQLERLVLKHCTIVPGIALGSDGTPLQPGAASLRVEIDGLEVEIEDCIIGAIRIGDLNNVSIKNSIVDANDKVVSSTGNESAVAYSALDEESAGATLKIVNSTIFGKLHSKEITLASNVIFHSRLTAADTWPAPVMSTKKQSGCVRFSYVPVGSRVPRRYRCQPELAVSQAVDRALATNAFLTDAEKVSIANLEHSRVKPTFTSQGYGDPGYAQLSDGGPNEISQGADDESEMGAFHNLFQPQREANLKLRLREYLRFGLKAGIFHAN